MTIPSDYQLSVLHSKQLNNKARAFKEAERKKEKNRGTYRHQLKPT